MRVLILGLVSIFDAMSQQILKVLCVILIPFGLMDLYIVKQNSHVVITTIVKKWLEVC